MEDARLRVESLLRTLQNTWADAIEASNPPPPRLDLMEEVLDVVKEYPALTLENYAVELFNQVEEEQHDEDLYGDDDDLEGMTEPIPPADRSILYYFLKNRATLIIIRTLLNVCPDRDSLVHRFNRKQSISTMCFACKYSSPDVIEFFAQHYPEMVNARCIQACLCNWEESIPVATIACLFGENIRPYKDTSRLQMLLRFALVEDWPEKILRRIVHYYGLKKFSSDPHPGLDLITGAQAKIISPLLVKRNIQAIFLPRVQDPCGFCCLINGLLDRNCNLWELHLRLPILSEYSQEDRESVLLHFKQVFWKTSSTRVQNIRLTCCGDTSSHGVGEFAETALTWFQAVHDAMVNNPKIHYIDLTTYDGLDVRILSHPLLQRQQDSLTALERRQLHDLKGITVEGSSPVREYISVGINHLQETSLDTDFGEGVSFIQALLSRCQYPSLKVSMAQTPDAALLIVNILETYPTLVGLDIEDADLTEPDDLIEVFRSVAGHPNLKRLLLYSTISKVDEGFKEKAKRLFLTFLRDGRLADDDEPAAPSLKLCDHLFSDRPDASTYYYLLLNIVDGRARIRPDTATVDVLLDVIVEAKDVSVDPDAFEDVPTEDGGQVPVDADTKKNAMQLSVVCGLLHEKPELWVTRLVSIEEDKVIRSKASDE